MCFFLSLKESFWNVWFVFVKLSRSYSNNNNNYCAHRSFAILIVLSFGSTIMFFVTIYFVRLTVKEKGRSNVKRIGLSHFDVTYLSQSVRKLKRPRGEFCGDGNFLRETVREARTCESDCNYLIYYNDNNNMTCVLIPYTRIRLFRANVYNNNNYNTSGGQQKIIIQTRSTIDHTRRT